MGETVVIGSDGDAEGVEEAGEDATGGVDRSGETVLEGGSLLERAE